MAEHHSFLLRDDDGFEENDEFTEPLRPQTRADIQDAPPSAHMDRAWAIAFKINVAVTLISAVYFGGTGLTAMANGEMLGGRRLSDDSGGPGLLLTAASCATMVGMAWAFSWGLLHSLINCSKQILQVAYLSFAAIWVVVGVSALKKGYVWFAIFPCLMGAFCVRFYMKRQSRIHFGAANLKVAALAIKSMPWTIRTALLMSGVQVLWTLMTCAAAAGSMVALETVSAPDGTTYRAVDCRDVTLEGASGSSCQCGGETISYNTGCEYNGGSVLLLCFYLASLVWGGDVFRNVVSATVTGSVASWWFTPEDQEPVRGAFYRATHSSFGSLCKAAAVSSIMQLVRMVVRRLSRVGRWLNYLLSWVQVVVDYFMAYTICFIGIYGLSFSEAGRRVGELFRGRGVTAIANDTVVELGLTLLAVASTIGYMLAVFLVISVASLAFTALPLDGTWFFAFLTPLVYGYLACVIVISTTLEVVRSGFKAVFVCFVQDPEALAYNHDRQLYDGLSRAWQEMHLLCPGARQEQGGTQV